MSEAVSIMSAAADWLTGQGISARTAWGEEEREMLTGPVVSVLVRSYAAVPGGFENYLGERYNEEKGAWEELYGKKVKFGLGLDLYAPETCGEAQLQEQLEKLVSALTLSAPEGLQVHEIACGETAWDEKQRCLKREVTAKGTAWLRAVQTEGTEFLDFELRGGWKI